MAAADVSLYPYDGRSGSLNRSSASDGAFSFAPVPNGRYGVKAYLGKLAATDEAVEVEVNGEAVAGLEVPVSCRGKISGRLHGLTPQEIHRVYVTTSKFWGHWSAEVAHDGTYVISGLLPGVWEVHAVVRDSARYARGVVQLNPDTCRASLDITFGSEPDPT